MGEPNITVLDYGSRWLKGGFAFNFPTDEEPRVLAPAAVTVDLAEGASGFDSEAAAAAAGANVQRPVRAGKIVSWDQFESLCYYMLYDLLGWELGNEGNILVCEPVLTSRPDREAMSQLMFEVFNVQGLFFQDEAVCSLYAYGRTSGLVVDIGHDKVDVTTVTEGLVNQSGVRRLPYGGLHLTRYLQTLMRQRSAHQQQQQPPTGGPDVAMEDAAATAAASPGSQLPPQELAEHEAEALKELCAACCEAERDFASACASAPVQSYTLPDGQVFSVAAEGLHMGEALFQPAQLLGVSTASLVEAAVDSVTCIPEHLMRKVMYENTLVVGGCAVVPGLHARFQREIRSMAPPSTSPAVCPVPEYMPDPHLVKHAAWMGGSVLAKVSMAQGHFITKHDYDQAGPGAVHRRCT